jgi:hypothetical protein
MILLLYHNSIKVLKNALAHLGPYQTLMEVWYTDPVLDLFVLLLCTRLYVYNVPVAEHVYFNLYDTHIYSLIMKSK